MPLLGIIEDDSFFRENFILHAKQSRLVDDVLEWDCAEAFFQDRSRKKEHLDLLFLDVRLPGLDGIDVLRRLSVQNIQYQVVMLSSVNSDSVLFEALRNGASGFIYKSELQEIHSVVQVITEGGAIISPTLALHVIHSFNRKERQKEGFNEEYQELTIREKKVLELLVCGMTAKDAAASLNISAHTLRVHVRNIYRKLYVSNKAELMLRAKDFGLF